MFEALASSVNHLLELSAPCDVIKALSRFTSSQRVTPRLVAAKRAHVAYFADPTQGSDILSALLTDVDDRVRYLTHTTLESFANPLTSPSYARSGGTIDHGGVIDAGYLSALPVHRIWSEIGPVNGLEIVRLDCGTGLDDWWPIA